jgi:hypothetical protein
VHTGISRTDWGFRPCLLAGRAGMTEKKKMNIEKEKEEKE